MPRFFFDLHDDIVSEDPDGAILPDPEAAYGEAIRQAREMAAQQARTGRLKLHHSIMVRDEAKQPLFSVTLRDAVEVEG